MTAPAPNPRYTGVAITLHWLIAFGIIGMIALGWTMGDIEDRAQRFALIQLHKSIGITILMLTLARIVWRLMNPPPPEPPMPPLQAFLANAVHVGFYVLMLAMPLTGWIMVSASPAGVGTMLYDTVAWPHIPGLAELPRETKEQLHEPLEFVHSKLAWVAIGLLVLHLAGAVKHHFVDKDGLIARMAPGLFGHADLPPKGRGLLYAAGTAVLVFALIAGYGLIGQGGASATAEQQQPTGGTADSAAAAWDVDPAQSSITFSSAYMGRAFKGSFTAWTADIQFDPAKPEDARIRVVVKTSSTKTGEVYFDENITEGDWFDSSRHPDAVFSVTQGVVKTGANTYEATGVLTLKGTDHPLRLPFTLDISGDSAKMHSEIAMSRTGLTIGRDTLTAAKGDEEWVQDEVKLVVDVVAKRR